MKIHNKKSVFKCDYCEKEFTRCDSYKNHISTHSNNKRFKCEICSSEFNYKSSFNRHMTTHSSGSFSCELCGKSFQRLDYVHSHKKQAHGVDSRHSKKITDKPGDLETTNFRGKKCRRLARVRSERKNSNEASMNFSLAATEDLSCEMKCLDADNFASEISNINAVPILMSMAENAANSVLKKPIKRHIDEECYAHSSLINDVSISPPQIDPDFISLLDESSNDEVSDCDSNASSCLNICMDNDEDTVKRVSCIVSNPSNLRKI